MPLHIDQWQFNYVGRYSSMLCLDPAFKGGSGIIWAYHIPDTIDGLKPIE